MPPVPPPGFEHAQVVPMRVDHSRIQEALEDFPAALILSATKKTRAHLSDLFFEIWDRRKQIAVALEDGTQCCVEIKEWQPERLYAVLFVRIPAVSSDADTPLYLWYSRTAPENTSYVGDVTDPAAQQVWSNGYAGVWHTPSGGQLLDSSPNGNHATIYGATLTTGPLGACYSYDGVDDYGVIPASSTLDMGGKSFSVQTLFRTDRTVASERLILEHGVWAGAGVYQLASMGDGALRFFGVGDIICAEYRPDYAGAWHDVWGVLDQQAAASYLYYDGGVGTVAPGSTGISSSGAVPTYLCSRAGAGLFLDCNLALVSISSTPRPPAWIAATNAALRDNLIIYDPPSLPGGDTGSIWHAAHGSLGELAGVTRIRVQDAYSRFARKATVEIIDPDGAIAADTPRDTSILLYAAPSPRSPLQLRFGGFVVDVRTNENVTTLDLLSYDFWLKRRVVYKTYSGIGLRDIAHDLVTTLTPLVWDPAQVDLTNDIVISQVWKGEALDSVLAQIAAMSKSEEWGADDEGRFFFREQDVRTSPRHFTEGWYTDARFEEDGRMEVNRVVIYYGQPPNTGAVAVQDRAAQLALQNRYGAPRPVVIEVARTYPEITTEEDARNRAAAILANRTVIRTGEIETWGAVRVRPGDVCAVRVPDQRIDGSYRVAQIEYAYPEDQAVVKLAENNEGVVDVLVELSDEVSRIDARDADPDATLLEVVNLLEEVEIETELAVYVIHVAAGVFLFGEPCGNLGDPHVGGGVLGDLGGRTRVI